ncbi:MAG: restriction endonuclease subunit S [Gammaproteobacteria bacterium]|nr:restriction endonuclease subunit S [Gammaproteobacteria bacterium]
MSFFLTTIKDVSLGVYDGPHATPKVSTSGHVFLGIKNVTSQGRLDLSKIKYVSKEEYSKWIIRVKPQCGDVVFSYEATLHRYAIIPKGFEGCLGRRMGLIRPDPKKINSRFLHYYFLSPQWQKYADTKVIVGATVSRFSIKDFPDFLLNIPSLEIQKVISTVLSQYDDLIENNRRRIQLLEESARLLYKEWFVHLRFPGHEQVKVVDGVPEGWVKKNLFEVSRVTYGFSFKSTLFSGDAIGLPVVRIRNIPSRVSKVFTIEEAPEEKLLENGDFLIGMDGDFHMNYWCGGKAWLNQRVVRVLGANGVSTGFVKQAIEKPIFDFNRVITGTTVRHLGAKHLKMIDFFIPDDDVLNKANDYFEDVRIQVVCLFQKIKKLEQARDILLPRLMSGELVV